MNHHQAASPIADAQRADATPSDTPRGVVDAPSCRTPATLTPAALADLALGGTDPAPAAPTSTDTHRLLSFALELSALLPGQQSLELRVDNLGPACATVRVDREDWPQAVRALDAWLETCIDDDDGDRVTTGPGFVNVYVRRRGLVRVRSAAVALAIGGAS